MAQRTLYIKHDANYKNEIEKLKTQNNIKT